MIYFYEAKVAPLVTELLTSFNPILTKIKESEF